MCVAGIFDTSNLLSLSQRFDEVSSLLLNSTSLALAVSLWGQKKISQEGRVVIGNNDVKRPSLKIMYSKGNVRIWERASTYTSWTLA